ncbi:TonB-dependent receptor plug domain-containing protein [Acetobacter fallax]|uniref:TonB-dependent receptor plug domain-containing protein n=1 Tax=Acetobacter fallax TaxID=1737473 RepID=A0ABX0KBD8_9PROT|nr:TonB-dependent receptor plug domain-containing protein [Acetobacter fallax]NHO32744.1 TonB-dependent receptor plug domain-containing protein [Acetobacter fallax]NHO36307.1 TonB-dependent receptor plug domain-containing protein [Acetobacter fallax]
MPDRKRFPTRQDLRSRALLSRCGLMTPGLCLFALMIQTAKAQSLDYSGFETLFGEPVTSSATGKPQRASNLPTDMQIITGEQIEGSGAQSVPEILRMVAGVNVRRYSTLGANVSIRGDDAAAGSRTLVLVDGRQVYLDGYGYTDWGLLPASLHDIRQIEVVRGPNSAVYGFNASGGVINIVTRDPLHENKSYVHIGGGSLGTFGGELVASHKFSDRLAAKFSLNGMQSDEYEDARARNTGTRVFALNSSLDLRGQITPRIDWKLSGTIGQDKSPFWLDIGDYIMSEPISKSLEGKINADTGLGLIEFRAYHNSFSSTNAASVGIDGYSIPIDFTYNLGTTDAQLSDTIALGNKNDLRLGVEYRYTTLNAGQSGVGVASGYDMLGAASAVWDYRISPKLTMTNAFRIDAFYVPSLRNSGSAAFSAAPAHHYVAPSFNSRLRYDAGNAGIFGLNVARGIQLPALFEFAPNASLGPVAIMNNSSLVPSTTINVGLNYSRKIVPLNANFTLALFAQRTVNMLGTPFASNFIFTPPATLVIHPANYGRVDDAGGEARLEGTTSFGLNWDVSYAMTSVRDLAQTSQINFERQTPVNSVIGGFSWKLGKFDLSSHARWQSHYQDVSANFVTMTLDNVMIHDFVTLNARVAWHFRKHFLLSLSADQMADSALRETAGLRIQRRLTGGLTAQF